MNLLDLGILVILLLVGLRGYYRGLLQEVSVIVGLVAGLIIAAHYYLSLARMMAQWVHTPLYSRIISFLMILMASYWIIRIAGHFLHRFASAIYLGSLDRVLGGAFGIVKGGVILGFLLTVITLMVPKDSKLLQESMSAPFLRLAYQQTLRLLPPEFKKQVTERALQFEREWGGKKRSSGRGEEI
ncbi:MAG: CvpA family protein [Deltaproteobacteria bacterium]|nr:CvpA family protein [Deltaproteobacteria bacterium]